MSEKETKNKYNSVEEIKEHREKLDAEYDEGLPPYLVQYFDIAEKKKKTEEFFDEKRRLKYSATPEEKKEYYTALEKEFWENNTFEIIKKKRRVPGNAEPVYTEPQRNIQRLDDEKDLSQEEIRILIKLCETDLYLFAIRYFSHFLRKPSSKFHKYLYTFLSENTNNRSKYSRGFKHAVAAPRGSAKSSIISAIYPLWCVCYNKKKFIIIVSDTAGQAVDFLSDIKREIDNNALLLRDFPHVAGKGPIWRADEIITKNDIKILSLGTGSKIRGRRFGTFRPDLLIFDDIENSDMLRSESERQHIRYSWFNKEALHVYGEKGTYTDFLFVGTILGKAALLYALLDSKEYPDWTGIVYKAVYSFSESDLWETWEELYKDKFDEDRISTARKFFEEHKEEMLEGTEVLWPEGDPYYDLMIVKISDRSAFECFKQGTPIVIENHKQIPIEEIKVGDRILSENGKYEKVTYLSKKESDSKIIKIKIAGVPDEIEATEEHPFLVWPLIKYQGRSLNHNYLNKEVSINKTNYRKETIINRILNNKLEWKLAKDLKIGDSVIQPIPSYNYSFDSKDKIWWWLVGYYLAEGSINYTNNTVEFAANLNERDLLEKTISICKYLGFGNTYTIRVSRHSENCIVLTVCSKILVNELKKFGRYSHRKYLTDEVFDICFDNFNYLWEGYYSGDGFLITRDKTEYEAVNSTSKELLIGFKNNWLKFGIVSYLYKSRKAGIGYIRNRKFNAKQLWSLQLVGKDRNPNSRELQAWVYNNNLYSRIQKIKIEDQGINIVYGLSVTGNKTYCIPSAVVHNSEKQNNPLDPTKIIITFDELRLENFNLSPWKDMIRNTSNPIYGSLDPSLGKKQTKGDPSCITTIIRDIKTGYILVFLFSLKRRTVDQQIEDILIMHKNLQLTYGRGYKLFSVESNIFQLVIAQNLKKLSRSTGIYVPIHEAIVKNDKKARFEKHVPLLRDGTVIFDTIKNRNTMQYNKAIEQISTFVGDGSDTNDDAVDGLSLALDLVTTPSFKLRTKQN